MERARFRAPAVSSIRMLVDSQIPVQCRLPVTSKRLLALSARSYESYGWELGEVGEMGPAAKRPLANAFRKKHASARQCGASLALEIHCLEREVFEYLRNLIPCFIHANCASAHLISNLGCNVTLTEVLAKSMVLPFPTSVKATPRSTISRC